MWRRADQALTKADTTTPCASNSYSVPSPGDVVSMASTATNRNGHTAVVTAVNVRGGSGTVTIMEENASTTGWGTINVSGNVLGSLVTGGLHNPRQQITISGAQFRRDWSTTRIQARSRPQGELPPHAWSVSSGHLPPGLALSSSGTISGIRTGPAYTSFGVTIDDAAGVTASAALTLWVPAIPWGPAVSKAPSETDTFYGGTNGCPYDAWWNPSSNGITQIACSVATIPNERGITGATVLFGRVDLQPRWLASAGTLWAGSLPP